MAIQTITRAKDAPKLAELAKHCHNGANNPMPLLRELGKAIDELQVSEVKDHPAVKIVIGQISYLCHESLGPTEKALADYKEWAQS